MRVELLGHSPEPERLVCAAARSCYAAVEFEGVWRRPPDPEFLRGLIRRGHESPLEHASFTFLLEGVSRCLTHQLVRHRLASYSQQSQRYVRMGEAACVVPPSVAARPAARQRFERIWQEALQAYRALLAEGVPAEDARYLLPQACQTRIVVTMNARELRHFFRLRLCRRAQWEIREAAKRMLALVRQVAPSLFRDAGPPCLGGECPEGERGCGGAEEVRRELAACGSA